ncbi:hypothetical protein BURCE16_18795 [Burkholderia cepacia]|nr:hypothetical protein BURCE16_18795 [Burkholderia cepacia]
MFESIAGNRVDSEGRLRGQSKATAKDAERSRRPATRHPALSRARRRSRTSPASHRRARAYRARVSRAGSRELRQLEQRLVAGSARATHHVAHPVGCYAARRDPDGFDAADREPSGQARRSIDARVRIATSCRFVHRARTDFFAESFHVCSGRHLRFRSDAGGFVRRDRRVHGVRVASAGCRRRDAGADRGRDRAAAARDVPLADGRNRAGAGRRVRTSLRGAGRRDHGARHAHLSRGAAPARASARAGSRSRSFRRSFATGSRRSLR